MDMEGEEGEVPRVSLPRYMAKILLAFGLLTTWDVRETGLADLVLVRLCLALWIEWSIKLNAVEGT